MSEFYTNLRDNTVLPLLTRFGVDGTYREHAAEVYDNATGKTVKGTPTDRVAKHIVLNRPANGASSPFQNNALAEQITNMWLVSANEFSADPPVEPKVNKTWIDATGRAFKILALKPISPSGVPVAFFLGGEHA